MNKFGILICLVLSVVGPVLCVDEEACNTCLTYMEEIAYVVGEGNTDIKSKLISYVCKGLDNKGQTALCQMQLVPILEAMMDEIVNSFGNPNMTCVEQRACSLDILSANIAIDSFSLDDFNSTCDNCTQEVENSWEELNTIPGATLVGICQINPGYKGNSCESRSVALRRQIKLATKENNSQLVCSLLGYCQYDFNHYTADDVDD